MQDAFAHVAAAPWVAVAVVFIAMVAAVVQFGLGMGFGLTAAPLLALIDPQLVPVSTLYLGLATSAWTAFDERGAVVWPEVWTAAVGRLIGVVVATAVLVWISDRKAFSLVFGLMVGLAVLLSVAGWRLKFSRPSLVAMATVSGLMGTITSVGAPPLAIVYQDRPAGQARPTLAAFFAVGCALSLVGLHLSGWAGPRDLALALIMVPGMLAGWLVARLLAGRFDKRYRPALLTVAAVAAVILVLRGLA
ncbi:sulfite transporter TauE/SafE [Zhengella mangrovi]|uniref:Probable membrane transporter protein n=1 Tax=Zhengella mangrovi TaxID=1982044 RepID=A0A2G1QTB6_9HYPH|nr:sulfite exporter TauE/SafE family protein [Zhengella mangrovi]PHP68694.1 sulfite transporter TauE/SafE [Zhengella mangrovi]